MNDFLKKLKLLEHQSIDIEIQKAEFISKLKQQVDVGSLGIFSDTADLFSSSKNQYKGEVGAEGFKIKRKRKFFDLNWNIAVASGRYRQENERLIIETEINGFNGVMIPFYLILLVFYTVFFITSLWSIQDGNGAGLFLPFILFHALFMFGIPFLIMRRSVSRMKHELEREFFYLTKK